MRFSASALLLAAAPLAASAFNPGQATFAVTKYTRATVSRFAPAPCAWHTGSCPCTSCGRVSLRMSEVAEETAAEVPAEVEALDGVASGEEAHNADRPARGSGIAKHKKSNKPGIPLSDLEVGAELKGKVKAVQSYGAFLDVGAQTDALCHVSRLSDDFVSNVEDVVSVGDEVSVRVVSVDVEKGQIAVTMRSKEAEEAAASGGGRRKERPRRSGGDRQAQQKTLKGLADSGFDDEKFVEGEVVSTLDFGAFVRFDASQLASEVEGELDGLVHISALAVGRTENVSEVAKPGDKVQIRVRSVDPKGGKVSLSMISKADEPKPRERNGGGGRGARPRWSPDEMGAKDWKESLEKFEQPSFANSPFIVDRSK
uniref:S1 motif domain-containing protein n=1 Tax=Odontella aurita TaxID=265563 RepID=A0A7S4MZS8_9STRA|mmetsp:Transcript_41994/g.127326  ORF Transcript_41994/g.127326 Transcript_41994/m.127326 type:complete len:370 (+) Transcript_41994:76-1185(+)|eukprot:CAMPEP_0113567714 /NCGR_PEP_ID=MMETSP0015_2-20120614/23428_1 /TAXON_ID=2838 /ORGANISM="Odontella" /LENGTH=369 /DNA_ID=CAMNT_0000470137 /DNA_START=722 /DNA_END=1831 /DNA_ORIENTATION=- /assembly_acc=CAM_ASM_000160